MVNPNAVRTGLNNLVTFTTGIWHQLDWSAQTYRQANGRFHRIGQTRPVTILIPYYQDTAQQIAFDLVARKISASLQVDGLDLQAALEAAGASDDHTTAMATAMSLGQAVYKALTGGGPRRRSQAGKIAPKPAPKTSPPPAPGFPSTPEKRCPMADKTCPSERVQAVAQSILEAFKTGRLPKALAQVFLNPTPEDSPTRRWSWRNRLLVALRRERDARGFRQWKKVGRSVKKGERAFHILGTAAELEAPETTRNLKLESSAELPGVLSPASAPSP